MNNNRKRYSVSKIDPNDTKIELNCRSVKPILLYLEEKYGREKMEEFIYDTKISLDYLQDRNNWISYEYFCRLLEKLVQYARDSKAPFTAGTYAAKKECFGALESFFSSLGTTAGTYKLGLEFALRYTKIGVFKMLELKKNYCMVEVRYFSNYRQNKNNCLNLQGIFASVPSLWNLPLAKIKETQCAAKGADSCVYKISWQNKPSHLLGLLGTLIALIFVYTAEPILKTRVNAFPMAAIIPIFGYLVGRIGDYKITLKDIVDIREKESRDLIESIETIEKLNIELQEKVEQRTEELQKALDELRKSQNQLVQSEKLASVGRLAAGMAHELNNPVGAIRNFIQDVLEDMPQGDPKRERLERAEKATGRCKRLVNDLLTFSRESKELKSVDINDIVGSALADAEVQIANPNIRISKELKPDLPKINIDPFQIQQVLMNIIMNAADAIKKEGRITVKTSSSPENIFVEISDTGEGIPAEIQNKIFDPFFTTKAPGKGKGLGLAISYNIVKRFNGDIHVKSEKDKGATFTITLPLENTMPQQQF